MFLYKRNSPANIIHYRYISMCNVTYKIIAKILVGRIRSLIDKIISPYQVVFVSKKWIVENTIIAQEILNTMKRKQEEEALFDIKIDMNKAYDKMELELILQVVMRRLGFPNQFCMPISQCLSTISYNNLL